MIGLFRSLGGGTAVSARQVVSWRAAREPTERCGRWRPQARAVAKNHGANAKTIVHAGPYGFSGISVLANGRLEAGCAPPSRSSAALARSSTARFTIIHDGTIIPCGSLANANPSRSSVCAEKRLHGDDYWLRVSGLSMYNTSYGIVVFDRYGFASVKKPIFDFSSRTAVRCSIVGGRRVGHAELPELSPPPTSSVLSSWIASFGRWLQVSYERYFRKKEERRPSVVFRLDRRSVGRSTVDTRSGGGGPVANRRSRFTLLVFPPSTIRPRLCDHAFDVSCGQNVDDATWLGARRHRSKRKTVRRTPLRFTSFRPLSRSARDRPLMLW